MKPSVLSVGDYPDHLWQMGRIIERHAQRVCIEFESNITCERCLAGEGCGAGVFSQLFRRKKTHLWVPQAVGLESGQWVRVGIHPRALLRGALWLYAWPLALFLVTVGVMTRIGPTPMTGFGEGMVLLLGLAVAAFGLWWGQPLRSRVLNPITIPLSCKEKSEPMTSAQG